MDAFSEVLEIVNVGPRSAPSMAQVAAMKKTELRDYCKVCRLDPRGKKSDLRSRLRKHLKKRLMVYKNKQLVKDQRDKYFDYLCVIDFECTCEDGQSPDYPHEIIEFPIVLLKVADLEIVDTFHSFIKPVLNPILSNFCIELTGITQEQVDSAPVFTEVYKKAEAWLAEHELTTGHFGYAFVTDGPWDLGRFLQMAFQQHNMPIPHHFRYWIDMRRMFFQAFRIPRINLAGMLKYVDLTFEGRQHSGLDDARNVARVAMALIERNVELRINQMLLKRDRLRAFDSDRRRIKGAQKRHLWEDEDEAHAKNVGQFILPYKVIGLTKNEFLMNIYENCLTCDEAESDPGESL